MCRLVREGLELTEPPSFLLQVHRHERHDPGEDRPLPVEAAAHHDLALEVGAGARDLGDGRGAGATRAALFCCRSSRAIDDRAAESWSSLGTADARAPVTLASSVRTIGDVGRRLIGYTSTS